MGLGKLITGLFKNKEIRLRILFTLAIFLIFRLGAALPAPNIDVSKIQDSLSDNSVLTILNLVGGGQLQTFSIFAMGVGPYITASIIIQLLSMDVIPALTEMAKSGQTGKMKMDRITRYLAIVLAFLQSLSMIYVFNIDNNIILNPSLLNFLYTAFVMSAGSMFLMWLGDQISTKGIGNGISMIIFAGIVSNLPFTFKNVYQTLIATASADAQFTGILFFIIYCLMYLAIIILVIFMQEAVRKIPIQYTSSVAPRGKDMNHLPLRINSASVIPVIFSSAVMAAPLTILSFVQPSWYTLLSDYLTPSKPVGLAIYLVLILLFTFYYTELQVDPEKMSENLGKNGSYIPGIRPGKETETYLRKVINRITVLGALFLMFIAALPYVLPMIFTQLPSSTSIGGTGILIVVGVALETVRDLEGRLTQKSYKGFIDR